MLLMASQYWLLPLAGFAVGLLIGLTGMGGGVLMTPLLMLGVGLSPSLAVGTDLAYAMFTKLTGAWQHWRQGTIDAPLVWNLAAGSVPASLAAVRLLAWLQQEHAALAEFWLARAVGLALVVAATLILQRFLRDVLGVGSPVALRTPHDRARVCAIGALGGFLVGLTSVGSGSLILALLVLVMPISTDKLVGTDIAHAALLVSVAAIAHFFIGDVDLRVAAWLLVGSVPGVLLGSRLMPIVPRQALQLLLAGLLFLSAVKLLSK